jgi:endonuclease/exonuclease/phosphatase family metal-dependent hydrolase
VSAQLQTTCTVMGRERGSQAAKVGMVFPPMGIPIANASRMTRLFLVLALAVAVAVAMAAEDRASPTPADPGRFRVMTYNIQFGENSAGWYTLARTADTIAASGASLVGLQQVVRNHAQFNCDDQPVLLAAMLRSRTGLPWQHAYVKEWDTENRDCLGRGRGDEWETEGLAFLAPEPFIEIKHVVLAHSRIGLMTRIASAPDLPVVVTHLASSAANQHQRVQQLEALLPWADSHHAALFIGDLNALPQSPELAPVFARYHDAWTEASRRGHAAGVRSGSTRPGHEARIDYVMYSPAAGLAVESVEVVDTSSWLHRTEASDHRPVIATFRRTAVTRQ